MFVRLTKLPITQFTRRTRFLVSASISFVFLMGCSTNKKRPEKNIPSAVATAAVPYSGHGQSSVSAEQLQKFQAKALPSVLSRRIQNMLDVRSPGMGLLHANKKELFFTWKVTGVNQVWRLTSPNSFPQQMTGGEDQTQIVGVDPQGQFIVVSRDRAGEENPGIYLQPTQGGALEVIQHKPKVQTTLSFIAEDGRSLFYRANDIQADSYALYRYDLKTKAPELLFSEKGYWLVADHQGSGQGLELLLQKVISNVASEFYLYRLADKQLVPLLGQNEVEDYQVLFGAKKSEYIVLTNKWGNFKKLYLFKDGQFNPLGKKEAVSVSFDISEMQMDHSRKHLIYTINEGGYTRLHAMDPSTGAPHVLPEFPGADHVYPGDMSLDGETLIVGVVKSQSPRLNYSYSWKTKKLTQWVTPSAPEVDLSQFAKVELESYLARDGQKIPMFVRRPPQCKTASTPCPVVVHFHGGPEAQSLPGFSVLAQMFVNEGFVYVEPNVRGSDGYGKAWIHADDGPKRLKVITDIPDCADWIRKNWQVAGQSPKVGVMGWSYGGYSTLMAMTKFAGSYDAGVALVGMSSLKTFLLNTAPYRRALRIAEYGDPEKDSEALDQLSAMKYLDSIKGPLLIIQGASDPRVPAGEAIQMYEAMKNKNLPSQLILFGDEGHGSQKRSNQVLEIGHTIEFLRQALK